MIYYTSDFHLGHRNVLKFDSRPFTDVGEMDRALKENWNNRVDVDDIVYILGDFSSVIKVVEQLSGICSS